MIRAVEIDTMSKQVTETARQKRARTSKFAGLDELNRTGQFEVVGIYEGNPTPQPMPFPNLSAALSRYAKIGGSNPALQVLRLIEYTTIRDGEGNQAGKKAVVLHQLIRNEQIFANGRNPWWESHR